MSIHRLSEAEIREDSRRNLETLERWLRRLIDQEFTQKYGPDYLEVVRNDGSRVVKAQVAETILNRRAKEPSRYPRAIDAALLDDIISIICNPKHFSEHFKPALNAAFPEGSNEARTFLSRLVPVRNPLSHANPISMHDAARVLCYSQDVIGSMKAHYRATNMHQEFNVPMIVRVTDSLGHDEVFSDSNRGPHGAGVRDYSHDPAAYLRCGDEISIEVEIDESFEPGSFEVEWLISNIGGPRQTGSKFFLLLDEQYVSQRFVAVCRVVSNQSWHKHGTHDDQLDIAYRVLPPL